MNAPTVTSDKLVIKKEGNGFVLTRNIEETLTRADIKKRIDELEGEKKRLNNERDKAMTFIQQTVEGLAECDKKIEALNKAMDEGFAEV